MTRANVRILAAAVCLPLAVAVVEAQGQRKGSEPVAGKGQVLMPLPDLVVTMAGLPAGYSCNGGILGLKLQAVIKNQGPGTAVLVANWTKPWIAASPSKPIPGFVKPLWSGAKTLTLKTGEIESVNVPATFPRMPDGSAYDIVVQVDPNNVIKETDENNNTAKISVPAKVCG